MRRARPERSLSQVGASVGYSNNFLERIKCSAMSAADSNIALLPILGFSAKLVMTSPTGLTNNFVQTNFGLRYAF